MTLREILDSLPPEDRKLIFGWFNNQESGMIQLAEGRFIGVNVPDNPDLEKLIEANSWCYGQKIKKDSA